jgi:hypothetical protein
MKPRVLPLKSHNPSAGQTIKSTHPAFELNASTHTSKTVDTPWAAGANTVMAHINAMEEIAPAIEVEFGRSLANGKAMA